MSIETALSSIDYLRKHSKKSKEVNIVFFGGEPLVNFDLIKKSIEYAKKIFTDQEISFSITTNATLLTPEIARFLSFNNVNVVVSIDGPEDIHDRYRRNLHGKGSYKDALRGLKNLFKAYGDRFTARVKLHMVYAPPFSLQQIKIRANLWDEIDWLTYDFMANIVYYSGPRLTNVSHNEDKNLMQWGFREYIDKKKKNEKPHPLVRDLIEKTLAIFSQRAVYRDATKEFTQNGCCVPGDRRILVTTSGDFRLCEQISDGAPNIGNVEKGIDLDALYKIYHKDYSIMSLQICKKCWAINICNSCFVDAFDEKGMSYDKKVKKCKTNRSSMEMNLYYFSKALEIVPNILDDLQAINLK
jgi:uncharacterized protein